jgi:heme exporter protein A
MQSILPQWRAYRIFPRRMPAMQLHAENLACARGDRQVFAGIGFFVGAGEALIVTGRNGAGKSSLLRLIAGLLRPSGGSISLDGAEPGASIAEQAHYLGHLDASKPALSVRENLEFWTHYLGGEEAAAALDAVGLGGLSPLPAGYLSAGQRRRLALARLVAVKRPLWLLDEPTAALDAPAQARLGELMRAHLAGGGIVVAASHGPIGLDHARELRLGQP